MSEQTPALLKKAQNGDARFFIQFGGQGNSFLSEARVLYKNYPSLKKYFEVAIQAVNDFMQRDDVKEVEHIIYTNGFDIGDWLTADEPPPAEYLVPSPVSFPGNQITQLATWHFFTQSGYPISEILKYTVGTTGHSQGLQAAVAISLGKEENDFYEMLYDFVYWFAVAGFYTQKIYGVRPVSEPTKNLAYTFDNEMPTPMAVVMGLSENALQELIHAFNKTIPESMGIDLSLVNTDQVLVITGHIDDVVHFRKAYHSLFTENKYTWNYVPVSAPFHRREPFEVGIQNFFADKTSLDFKYKGSDLKLPVYSFHDGSNLQEAGPLSEIMASTMVMSHLNWRLALSRLTSDESITHVIDFGPGKISAMLTRGLFRSNNRFEIISAVGKAGMNKLLAV